MLQKYWHISKRKRNKDITNIFFVRKMSGTRKIQETEKKLLLYAKVYGVQQYMEYNSVWSTTVYVVQQYMEYNSTCSTTVYVVQQKIDQHKDKPSKMRATPHIQNQQSCHT